MGLGLIRIVLAVSVLITHSIYSTSLSIPGAIAVKLFFIISGFYMAMILCEKYAGHHRLFYKNRFLRLYPLYITTVALILLLGAATAVVHGRAINNSFAIFDGYQDQQLSLATAVFLVFSNISMLLQDIAFFLGPDAHGDLMWATREQMAGVPFFSYLLIPQAWSLSLEIIFYAAAPFVVKRVDRILLWMGVSIIVRTALFILDHNEEQFIYRFFPAELVFFLAGSLSYHVHQKIPISLFAKYERYVAAAIVLTIGGYQLIPAHLEAGVRLGLYVALAVSIPYIFRRSRNSALDNQIGELSYPFYILHIFTYQVLLVVAPRVGISTKGLIFLLAWIASTLALSHVLIRFVQAPFERIRKRAFQR